MVMTIIATNCNGQEDSVHIIADQIKWSDVKPPIGLLSNREQISASRFSGNSAQTPFTILTLSGDELRSKGVTTLAEALALLPGVQAHTVGSSINGSMFDFRGLSGNNYAKFLINDVNIKPFVVGGMPIGEQLPIAFVERIEVLYGSAATIYGADASAGVINIITKNSPRPFSVFGNIRYGSQEYQSVNLKFNINRSTSKRRLEFGIFASFSDRHDLNIYDGKNFELTNYNQDTSIFNYIYNFKKNINGIQFNHLPQRSKSVGGQVRYNQFSMNFAIMSRSDHAAIGSLPLSTSYSNPQNFFGEKISSFNIMFNNKESKRFKFKAILSLLGYNIDDDANIEYVLPTVGLFSLYAIDSTTTRREALAKLEKSTFGGNQQLKSNSLEGNAEFIGQYPIRQNFLINFGINTKLGFGPPLVLIRTRDSSTVEVEQSSHFFETSGFVETNFVHRKWSFVLGMQALRRNDLIQLSSTNIVYNPRAGMLYEFNKSHNIRANYSTAYRIPSPFYGFNSLKVSHNDPLEIMNTFNFFKPERTRNVEIGYRWLTKNFSIDLSMYRSTISQVLNFHEEIYIDSTDFYFTSKWINDEFSQRTNYGVQASFTYLMEPNTKIKIQNQLHFNYNWGNEKVTINTIDWENLTSTSKLFHLPYLNAIPQYYIKLQHNIQLSNWSIFIHSQFFSKRKLNTEVFDRSNSDISLIPAFYLLDMKLNFQPSKNGILSVCVNNVLNKKYAGIKANPSSDALIFNPQPLRNWFVSATYFLD